MGDGAGHLRGAAHAIGSRTWWTQAFLIFFLFIANFLIFMGPLLLMGISQIRGYEPGDAEWGVKLDHVRGQAEAKEEIRRVVTLWQSGEVFEGSGGKRERGLLFLGAPGTGKTMMAKAIATGFNSPFVSIPGSGFAQTFIGIDAVIVRFLARKAKKLASEVGRPVHRLHRRDRRRRHAPPVARRCRQAAVPASDGNPLDDYTRPFYGPMGALNPSGDIIVESAAWRDYVFAQRAPEPRSPYPPFVQKIGNIVNQGIFPGMGGMGGGLALNQLLVVMDGIDNPPFFRRVVTNKTNAFLDAIYFVPRRVGKTWDGARSPDRLAGSVALVNGIAAVSGFNAIAAPSWIVWRMMIVLFEILIIYLGIEAFRAAGKNGTLRCDSRAPSRRERRSTSSARPTSRCRTSTRRSRGRAAWAATSPSGRRPRKTARTSSTSTSRRSRTTPTSTRRSGATRWRASRAATRRR